jgi:hypothetical protein
MRKVSYAQMDKVLSSLGFSIRVVTTDNKFRVYEHEPTGALFWLAYRPDNETVWPHHMAAVEGKLKQHGIVDPLDFALELQNAS